MLPRINSAWFKLSLKLYCRRRAAAGVLRGKYDHSSLSYALLVLYYSFVPIIMRCEFIFAYELCGHTRKLHMCRSRN